MRKTTTRRFGSLRRNRVISFYILSSGVPETFLPLARSLPMFRKRSCPWRGAFRRSGILPAVSAELSGKNGSRSANGSLSSDAPENVQPITGGFREAEAGAPLKIVLR
ncbi:MAG: hypothetical protein GZ094_03860 [Mariniphaga sp.]|nr:hypothetical protein [Mariniphaga sp.]